MKTYKNTKDRPDALNPQEWLKDDEFYNLLESAYRHKLDEIVALGKEVEGFNIENEIHKLNDGEQKLMDSIIDTLTEVNSKHNTISLSDKRREQVIFELGIQIATFKRRLKTLEKDLKRLKWRLKSSQTGKISSWELAYQKATTMTRIEDICAMYMNVERGFGINYKCPFHEDATASLKIYIKSNRFICFGCNAQGSPIDMVMRFEGCDFKEAVNKIARL